MSGVAILNINSKELQFAIHAVGEAAAVVRQVQQEMSQGTLLKSDQSPVTVGDLASQALVGKSLKDVFPQDQLVAEEDSDYLRSEAGMGTLEVVTGFVERFVSGATPSQVCDWIDTGRSQGGSRFWTLDPIDGTKGFLRGGQYAVALALIVDGQVELGVLACPGLVEGVMPDLGGQGSILAAVRGQGAWTTSLSQPGEFTRVCVSDIADPADIRLLRSFEDKHTDSELTQTIANQLGIEAEPVRMDSQAKYAILAAGGGEALLRLLSPTRLDYREKIWDQAAGSIVIEEAGGKVTDLDGTPLDFSLGRELMRNRGILATNGLVHDAFLQALKFAGA